MLGFDATGRLATATVPVTIAQSVGLTGLISVQARAQASPTNTTALTARGQVVVQNRAPGGVILSGRDQIVVQSRTPGGVNLPARIGVQVKSRAPGGINLPSRIGVQVKSFAPGGIVLNARGKGAQVTARFQGGYGLSGRIHNQVAAYAPGGMAISGRITTITHVRLDTPNTTNASDRIQLIPRPIVRDWWDRDEWGNFIPGGGYHTG